MTALPLLERLHTLVHMYANHSGTPRHALVPMYHFLACPCVSCCMCSAGAHVRQPFRYASTCAGAHALLSFEHVRVCHANLIALVLVHPTCPVCLPPVLCMAEAKCGYG
eukprot:scaffold87798_cov17-Tisochrysis_lutea.AAC.1